MSQACVSHPARDLDLEERHDRMASTGRSSCRRRSSLPGDQRNPLVVITVAQEQPAGATSEAHPRVLSTSQNRPPEFPNVAGEIVFILVCSIGQLYFALMLGNVEVNLLTLVRTLELSDASAPWLIGSYLLATGISVSLFGSLLDLVPPKRIMVGAFFWLTIWNFIGVFAVSRSRWVLFFVVRAMQGLALGMLLSGSFSILGRLYRPGKRKTQVFAVMSSFPPMGFCMGLIQGGALVKHIGWVFGSTAILSGICTVAAIYSIPPLLPVKPPNSNKRLSMRDFDIAGAFCLMAGNTFLIFGITQGSTTNWNAYTYSLIIVGVLSLIAFYFVEQRTRRPLVAPHLWSTPGFAPLMVSYFLAYGSYIGAWQYYAVQFLLSVQNTSPLKVGLYFIPNAIAGLTAVWVVSRILHQFANQWIFAVSMLANALGPAFFLPQTPRSNYWALSMPGIALASFGPDMTFVATSIFITSNVPRSYQGAAGSILMTTQNLGPTVIVAVAGAIAVSVNGEPSTERGAIGLRLDGLRASWWFAVGLSVAAAVLTMATVRIAKAEERDHVAEGDAD